MSGQVDLGTAQEECRREIEADRPSKAARAPAVARRTRDPEPPQATFATATVVLADHQVLGYRAEARGAHGPDGGGVAPLRSEGGWRPRSVRTAERNSMRMLRFVGTAESSRPAARNPTEIRETT